jgi:hypothetical protein
MLAIYSSIPTIVKSFQKNSSNKNDQKKLNFKSNKSKISFFAGIFSVYLLVYSAEA